MPQPSTKVEIYQPILKSMKSKSNFTEATSKDVIRSGFHGYLHISYPELVEKLGMPHDRTQEGEWWSGDNKVRAEWAFKSKDKKRPMVVTIYDYKETRPITEVNQWHVGIRGDTHQVVQLFRELGIYSEALEIQKRYR